MGDRLPIKVVWRVVKAHSSQHQYTFKTINAKICGHIVLLYMLVAVRFHGALNWWIFCSFDYFTRHSAPWATFPSFFWISFKIFLVVITKFMFYSRHLKHLESEMIFAKIYLPANKKMSNSCVLTQWPAPAHSPYVNLFCLCELGHVPIFCNYCRFSFLLRFCVSKFKMMIISFCMIYFKLS